MEITIQTMYGTFIVPSNKVHDLVAWLRSNAIQANGSQTVHEVRGGAQTNRQLINE